MAAEVASEAAISVTAEVAAILTVTDAPDTAAAEADPITEEMTEREATAVTESERPCMLTLSSRKLSEPIKMQ